MVAKRTPFSNSKLLKSLTYLRDMTCTLSFSRAVPRSVILLFSFAKASFKSATRVRSLFSEFVRSFCTCSACCPLTNTKSHQKSENCEFSCSLQYCAKVMQTNFDEFERFSDSSAKMNYFLFGQIFRPDFRNFASLFLSPP